MSDEERFTYESLQDKETITKYFHALAKGFESGELTFNWKESELILRPEGLLAFDLEAKVKDNRRKLTLKISWSETEREANGQTGPLTIESGKGED